MGNKSRLYQLDHVILLLPYHDIVSPPTWLTDHFTITPGGTHADGKTANNLVIFQDGTYLELIAFVNDDPENRAGHWWDKKFGIVDYALTTSGPFDYDGLIKRLENTGTGVSYEKPKAGGRKLVDGRDVKWEVTFPTGVARGFVPFWCSDVTDRKLRVPLEKSIHPCGVAGMAGVEITLANSEKEKIQTATAAIVEAEQGASSGLEVGRPVDVGVGPDPVITLVGVQGMKGDPKISLLLQSPVGRRPDNIERDVGNGHVSIRFQ